MTKPTTYDLWLSLCVSTLPHEVFCNCADHEEMRRLGAILSDEKEAENQAQRARIIKQMDDPNYFQTTIYPSKPIRVGKIMV